jgi:hypothetical protein
MPAINKTTRQAHKTVKRISGILKKAKKHHAQAKKSVAVVKKAHAKAKAHAKSTKKGMSRKTARKAYM